MNKTGEKASGAPGASRGSKREWLLWGSLAAGVGMTASLINLLLFHSYPILSAEVGIVWAILMLAAVGYGVVLAGVRFSFRVILGGVLAMLLADWNMANIDWPFVIGVAGLLVVYRMGVDAFRFVAIAFAVIGVTSLLGLGQRGERFEVVEAEAGASRASEDAPPLLVHLILDEFEGVRGMNALPGQEGAGDALAASLMAQGFTVYDDAHTTYYRSVSSIPALLNYGALGTSRGDSNDGGATGRTRWLSDLKARGYEVEVVQSSFVDLCSDNEVARCRTYWRENLNGVREAGLPVGDRVRLLFIHIGRQLTLALMSWDRIEPVVTGEALTREKSGRAMLKHRGEANTLNSLAEFRRLPKLVATKGAGDAIVAHVLVPHFPYATDDDCSVKRLSDWQMPWQSTTLETRAAAYIEQVRCTTALIERVADAAERASGGRFVMIVNGDHGSRMGRELPTYGLRKGDPDTLLHAGSALFAVRLETPAPGRMKGAASLGELMEGMEAGAAPVPHEPDGIAPQLLEPPVPDGRTLAPIDLDWE